MPQSYGERGYTRFDAVRYVKYLGCWTFVDIKTAIVRRDPNDYRELLLKLIEANKSRNDDAGKWETTEARKQLKALRP